MRAVLPAPAVWVTAAPRGARPARGDGEEPAPALPAPPQTRRSFPPTEDPPRGLAGKVGLDRQITVERDFYNLPILLSDLTCRSREKAVISRSVWVNQPRHSRTFQNQKAPLSPFLTDARQRASGSRFRADSITRKLQKRTAPRKPRLRPQAEPTPQGAGPPSPPEHPRQGREVGREGRDPKPAGCCSGERPTETNGG